MRISPESSFDLRVAIETYWEVVEDRARFPMGKELRMGATAGDWASAAARNESLGTLPISVVPSRWRSPSYARKRMSDS
jgi:hypothetical protein